MPGGAGRGTEQPERARRGIPDADRVTVLTGPGLAPAATSDAPEDGAAGITGAWTAQGYRGDPALRARSWRRWLRSPAWTGVPSAEHTALVALERSGRLVALLTQSTDGLHRRAGSDPARLVELHGSDLEVECLDCLRQARPGTVRRRLEAGEADPACPHCGGILRSRSLLPGEAVDPDLLYAAVAAVRACDLLLVTGADLDEALATSLMEVAERSGAAVLVIDPRRLAAVLLSGDADGGSRGPHPPTTERAR